MSLGVSELRMAERWQGYKGSLIERTSHLLDTGHFSDVKILLVWEECVKAISAHKVILSISSPVFATMFESQAKETERIIVKNISPRAFSKLLRYIYTDDLNIGENIDEVLELYYAAKKFMISKLTEKCDVFLQSVQLDPKTVCRAFETARKLSIQSLEDRCATFFSTSTTDVLRSEEFINAKQETVQTILELEEVSISSEVEMFSALLSWGRAECNRKNLEANPENMKTIVEPLILSIRFLAMSVEEFISAMNNAEYIFDGAEAFKVCTVLNQISKKEETPSLKYLPKWCTTSRSRRQIPSDTELEINLEEFHVYHRGDRLFVKSEPTSYLFLTSFRNNLIIKGVQLQFLGLKKKGDEECCNGDTTQCYYKLKARNLITGIEVNIENTLTTGKEFKVIFPKRLPVAYGERMYIAISLENPNQMKFETIILAEHVTADFLIDLESNNDCTKHFIIKKVICFVKV